MTAIPTQLITFQDEPTIVLVAAAVASGLTALIVLALEPLVPSCAAPRLPVAEPVYSADAVYDQVRESTVLAVENAKHAVGMA